MSNKADFHDPIYAEPIERDPESQGMMTEERLLERLHLGIHTALPLWHPQHIGAERRKYEVEELLKDTADYIKQRIAEQNQPPVDQDEEWADPFAEDE